MKIDERQLKIAKSDVSLPAAPPNATVGAGVKFASWIPVYGHAVGGRDGEFILNGNQVTEVLAPASLSSRTGIPSPVSAEIGNAALGNLARQAARSLCPPVCRTSHSLVDDQV